MLFAAILSLMLAIVFVPACTLVYAEGGTHTVSYQLINAPEGVSTPESRSYSAGDTVTLPSAQEVEGYYFTGWSYDDGFEMPDKDVTVAGTYVPYSNAHFLSVGYIQKVDGNGYEYFREEHAIPETSVITPKREGFHIQKVVRYSGTEYWMDHMCVTYSDRNSYPLTYELTGDIPPGVTAPDAEEYLFEAPITLADAQQVEGYTFSGWTGAQNGDEMPIDGLTVTGSYTKDPEPAPTPTPSDPPADPTPTPTTPTTGGGGGNGGGGGTGGNGGGNNAGGTALTVAEVNDAATPAATPATTTEPATIADPETPLAESADGGWALVNLICAGLTAVGAAIAAFHRKEEDDEEDEEDGRGRKMFAAKAAGILAAIASVATFLITEDMTLPMIMIDKWTALMAIMLGVQVVSAVLNKKASETDEYEETETQAVD